MGPDGPAAIAADPAPFKTTQERLDYFTKKLEQKPMLVAVFAHRVIGQVVNLEVMFSAKRKELPEEVMKVGDKMYASCSTRLIVLLSWIWMFMVDQDILCLVQGGLDGFDRFEARVSSLCWCVDNN